jgi:hypothetical protein
MFLLPQKFTLDTNVSVNNKVHNIMGIKMAIERQLRERVIFIKPKDAIVADLLYTLARIDAQTSIVEGGLEYLELSKLYGFSNPKLLEEKRTIYSQIKDNVSLSYHLKKWFSTESILYIVIFTFLWIIAILIKRLLFFIYRRFFQK